MTETNTRSARDRSAPRRPRRTRPPPLGTPLFVLNLKTFRPAVGIGGLRLARALEGAGRAAGVPVAIAPATPDLSAVARAVRIPVLAQHTDPVPDGPSTGYVPPEVLARIGVRGSLVNHSEHPVRRATVGTITGQLREAGLSAIVCAPTPSAARALGRFSPPYLAIEPPELIGGDRAVSTARPRVVVDGVAAVRSVSPATAVLCGAGVRRAADVKAALALGAEGVLVASSVALSPRPRAVLSDLLSAF